MHEPFSLLKVTKPNHHFALTSWNQTWDCAQPDHAQLLVDHYRLQLYANECESVELALLSTHTALLTKNVPPTAFYAKLAGQSLTFVFFLYQLTSRFGFGLWIYRMRFKVTKLAGHDGSLDVPSGTQPNRLFVLLVYKWIETCWHVILQISSFEMNMSSSRMSLSFYLFYLLIWFINEIALHIIFKKGATVNGLRNLTDGLGNSNPRTSCANATTFTVWPLIFFHCLPLWAYILHIHQFICFKCSLSSRG